MRPIKATLDGLPPTTNHLYVNATIEGRPRRVLSPAARKYKAETLKALRLFYSRPHKLPLTPQYLAVEVVLYGQFLNKGDGLPKRTDSDGRLKALLDCLAEWLGVDDRWFFDVTIRKRHHPDMEQTQVTVSALPLGSAP